MKNIMKLMSLIVALGATTLNPAGAGAGAAAALPCAEVAVIDTRAQEAFVAILNQARLDAAEKLATADLVVTDADLATFIEAAKHILPPIHALPTVIKNDILPWCTEEGLRQRVTVIEGKYVESYPGLSIYSKHPQIEGRMNASRVETAYAKLTQLRGTSKKYWIIVSDEVIISLLEAAHYDLNEKDASGSPFIYKATASNKHRVVQALLKRGVNPNEPFVYDKDAHGDNRETYPIIAAVQNLDLAMVRMLCQAGARANVKKDGYNLCHTAAEACGLTTDPAAFREVIALLVAHGADLNELSTYGGGTPLTSLFLNLHYSAFDHTYALSTPTMTHAQAIQILIDAKADVNKEVYGEYGRKEHPLFQACRYQLDANVIDALVKGGADRSHIAAAREKILWHLSNLGNDIYYSGHGATTNQAILRQKLRRSLEVLKAALPAEAGAGAFGGAAAAAGC